MKFSIFCLFSVFLLTSCISTQKYTSFVQPRFSDVRPEAPNGTISYELSALGTSSATVNSTKLKKQFIPAIFYWQWNNTIRCQVEERTVGRCFAQSFSEYADQLKLNERLNGRSLELKIEKMPNSFVWTHKGYALILILGYMTKDLEVIVPQAPQELEVSFRITGSEKVQEGKLTAKGKDQPLDTQWKSTKRLTGEYVTKFRDNISQLAKETAENIAKEL